MKLVLHQGTGQVVYSRIDIAQLVYLVFVLGCK